MRIRARGVAGVGPSAWLWKEEAGYYRERPEDLARRPILPDLGRLRDRRVWSLFETHGGLRPGARVLEIGCGRSPWLPILATRGGCEVSGIDLEPHAAALARANLSGAGAGGVIHCGDAFIPEAGATLAGRFDLVYSMGLFEHFDDVVPRLRIAAGFLRPGGRLLTTVPNLQGVNGFLQRLGDRRTYEAHVVYDAAGLARVHREAGLEILASGYAGFCDAWVTRGGEHPLRARLHAALCRNLGRGAAAWTRLLRDRATPEWRFLAPHVYCAGRRA